MEDGAGWASMNSCIEESREGGESDAIEGRRRGGGESGEGKDECAGMVEDRDEGGLLLLFWNSMMSPVVL